MKVIHILICSMISFGLAQEDHLLQEDENPDSHQESRQLAAPAVLGNLRADEDFKEQRLSVPTEIVPSYIDPKCCNFSTTNLCSRMGDEGYKGYCMSQNETCYGREYEGNWYCSINNHQSCKCCVPTDCSLQTLSPCAKLNGTCMGINDDCIGESVVGKDFCKQDTKNETCKCCYNPDCPCGQDYYGGCYGVPSYPGYKIYGGPSKYPSKEPSKPVDKRHRGRCMKSCDDDYPRPLTESTCNITGGKDCKCCADCGSKRCSSNNPVYSCICTVDGYKCPYGQCSMPDVVTCPEGSCSCCQGKHTGCYSYQDQCSAPKDYCVNRYPSESECPQGFAKVHNACDSKKKLTKPSVVIKPSVGVRKGNSSTDITKCDCCKSTACSSIDNRCTGPGSYCVDQQETCPEGYEESLDCSRPIIGNGIWIDTILCKCCKPKPIVCYNGCSRVGSQCFIWPRDSKASTSNWTEASAICAQVNNTLAEPECPQALSQYLATNTNDTSFWIGAHGTHNGSAVWVSGGVIGSSAPWFANSYETCDNPNCCVNLQVNSACTGSNQCLGDSKCNWGESRTPLCACKNPFK